MTHSMSAVTSFQSGAPSGSLRIFTASERRSLWARGVFELVFLGSAALAAEGVSQQLFLGGAVFQFLLGLALLLGLFIGGIGGGSQIGDDRPQ